MAACSILTPSMPIGGRSNSHDRIAVIEQRRLNGSCHKAA
jgi:hypothetical protein